MGPPVKLTVEQIKKLIADQRGEIKRLRAETEDQIQEVERLRAINSELSKERDELLAVIHEREMQQDKPSPVEAFSKWLKDDAPENENPYKATQDYETLEQKEESHSAQNAQVTINTAPRVQITERTSKEWKVPMLIGGLMFLCSPLGCAAAIGTGSYELGVISVMAFLFGPLVWFLGYAGGWWHHG
jgi:hypothetical protein